ncbi:5233_t:CDS:2, partial [Entrophospora sp. SA101]
MSGGEKYRPDSSISAHTKPECQWITLTPSTAPNTTTLSTAHHMATCTVKTIED